MAQDTLRVLPRGTAMVPHYERMGNVGHGRPVVAPHGWKHDPNGGPEIVGPQPGQSRTEGAFVKHVPEVIVVPDCVEYRRHLRDGDLWPADQATAQAAGVPFDPHFGGDEELAHHAPVAAPEEVSPDNSEWPDDDRSTLIGDEEIADTKPEPTEPGFRPSRFVKGDDVKSALVELPPDSPAPVAEKV
jgi:hypothetical protein